MKYNQATPLYPTHFTCKTLSHEKIELTTYQRKFQGLQLLFSSNFSQNLILLTHQHPKLQFFSIRANVKVTLQAMLSTILLMACVT